MKGFLYFSDEAVVLENGELGFRCEVCFKVCREKGKKRRHGTTATCFCDSTPRAGSDRLMSTLFKLRPYKESY